MEKKNNYSFYTLSLLILAFIIGGWNTCQSQVNSFPHFSSFELGFGDWRNAIGDDFNWSHVNGSSTPSGGTGPQIGPPFGGKNTNGYVYIESSSPNYPNMEAWLELVVDFSMMIAPEMNFSYNMYASNGPSYGPGILQLDIYDGSAWIYNVWSNNISDINWQTGSIDLSPYATQPFVILSWTGYSIWWQSDICLDEIIIQDKGGSLPIVLSNLSADQDYDQANIMWSVLSQVNNDYFTVERSLDCYEWETVGQCAGNGTSSQEVNFVMIDKTPYSGLSYYRLTQTDFNGDSETFRPVSLYMKRDNTIGLNIIPNPAIDYIELEMDYTLDPDISHDVRIYDIEGHKVYRKHFIGEIHDFKINIQKLPSGIYLLKTESENIQGNGTFIKQ